MCRSLGGGGASSRRPFRRCRRRSVRRSSCRRSPPTMSPIPLAARPPRLAERVIECDLRSNETKGDTLFRRTHSTGGPQLFHPVDVKGISGKASGKWVRCPLHGSRCKCRQCRGVEQALRLVLGCASVPAGTRVFPEHQRSRIPALVTRRDLYVRHGERLHLVRGLSNRQAVARGAWRGEGSSGAVDCERARAYGALRLSHHRFS